MRLWTALLLLVATLLVSTTSAVKRRKRIRHQSREQVDQVGVAALADGSDSSESSNFIQGDPCATHHCGAGKVCRHGEDGEPLCVCVSSCPSEVDPRRKVCSNKNETWPSDCELYQTRCLCETLDDRCKYAQDEAKMKEAVHLHIDYYGECKEMEPCPQDQMADFPRRMRDWLFNIMKDLADREQLSPHYLRMEQEAETNHTKRWANAAVWKWCSLDSSHDRAVSRHELFPIRAPLVSMENCIAPFLDKCDEDNDHRITLHEWATCLEIEQDSIEEQCEGIREDDVL